jgi:hypothetical protein
MRLDFNVLWVEDQPQSVQAYRAKIDRLIRKEGFKLQTEFAVSIAEAKKFLSSEVFGDHIDLVLMDYDLGVSPMGDEGLVVVRDLFSYKDIVFYSADVAGLLKKVAEKKIQGIFCSTRDDLPDTVEGVFEALVKKVIDIDHSRGIVMGATSDIDHFVNDCLVSAYEQSDGASRKKALALVAKRIAEIRKRFEEGVAKVGAVSHVSELFDLHHIYTSVDRLHLLRKILIASGKHKDQCASMQTYAEKTMPKRNDLAHLRVRRNGFSRKLFDRYGKELTSDEMRELRRALLEHQEMFEALATALKGS